MLRAIGTRGAGVVLTTVANTTRATAEPIPFPAQQKPESFESPHKSQIEDGWEDSGSDFEFFTEKEIQDGLQTGLQLVQNDQNLQPEDVELFSTPSSNSTYSDNDDQDPLVACLGQLLRAREASLRSEEEAHKLTRLRLEKVQQELQETLQAFNPPSPTAAATTATTNVPLGDETFDNVEEGNANTCNKTDQDEAGKADEAVGDANNEINETFSGEDVPSQQDYLSENIPLPRAIHSAVVGCMKDRNVQEAVYGNPSMMELRGRLRAGLLALDYTPHHPGLLPPLEEVTEKMEMEDGFTLSEVLRGIRAAGASVLRELVIACHKLWRLIFGDPKTHSEFVSVSLAPASCGQVSVFLAVNEHSKCDVDDVLSDYSRFLQLVTALAVLGLGIILLKRYGIGIKK